MGDMRDFVSGQNIDNFVERLSVEPKPEVRETLHRLLLAEEANLGKSREHLEAAERRMLQGRVRIVRLKNSLADGGVEESDRERTLTVLSGLQETQILLEDHVRKLQDRWAPL